MADSNAENVLVTGPETATVNPSRLSVWNRLLFYPTNSGMDIVSIIALLAIVISVSILWVKLYSTAFDPVKEITTLNG